MYYIYICIYTCMIIHIDTQTIYVCPDTDAAASRIGYWASQLPGAC